MYSQHTERVGPGDGLAGAHEEAAVLAGPGEQLLRLGAGDVAMVPAGDHGGAWASSARPGGAGSLPHDQHTTKGSGGPCAATPSCPLSVAPAAATSSLTDDFLFQALCEGKETSCRELPHCRDQAGARSSTFPPLPPALFLLDGTPSSAGQRPADVLGELAAPLVSGGSAGFCRSRT